MNKVKLKEICRLINGRAYKQQELLDNGKYPVLRVGNFFSDKDYYYSDLELEEDKYCDNGDLLFAWSASFGPKIWNGGKVIYHYHIWKMELSESVDRDYLYYYLFHLSERIKSEGHGGIMIHTTKAEMEEREFVLPDLIHQKQIAELLSKVTTVIEMRKQELLKLDELIKARFVEMFGDPRSNPFGFDERMLKDTCKVVTGNTPSREVSKYYGNYVEWIKTDNIVSGLLNPTKATECLSEKGMEAGRIVERDSILMACIAGSIASIGRVCVTDRIVAFNQQINAVVPEKYNVLFLYVLLQASKDYLVEDVNMALKGILSKSKLEEKKFIVPPIELQEQFAELVKQVNKSKLKKLREISHI